MTTEGRRQGFFEMGWTAASGAGRCCCNLYAAFRHLAAQLHADRMPDARRRSRRHRAHATWLRLCETVAGALWTSRHAPPPYYTVRYICTVERCRDRHWRPGVLCSLLCSPCVCRVFRCSARKYRSAYENVSTAIQAGNKAYGSHRLTCHEELPKLSLQAIKHITCAAV